MTETPPQLIHCDLHGPSKYGIICTHLCEKNSLGYYAISAEEDEPAQAWCKDCDQVLESERGWTEKASNFAEWKLYCSICYQQRLQRQTLIQWVDGS